MKGQVLFLSTELLANNGCVMLSPITTLTKRTNHLVSGASPELSEVFVF